MVPPKKHIIVIGVLCVIALGLGYVYGKLGGDAFSRRLCIIIGLLVVCIGVIYGVLQDVFSGRSKAFLTFCILAYMLSWGLKSLDPMGMPVLTIHEQNFKKKVYKYVNVPLAFGALASLSYWGCC